jgi:integrase
MALSDVEIKNAKPSEADRKLADAKGLYLLVTTSGSKLWRLKYRINGKEKKLALGSYPEVSLKAARAKCDEARSTSQAGTDPAVKRREEVIAKKIAAGNTFQAVAEEFIEKIEAEGRADITVGKTRWLLKKLSPALGKRPISEISPFELLSVLKAVEKRGQRETARRLRSFSSRVFRYAVATARATSDPAQPLIGALIAPVVKHHAAITDPIQFGSLMRAIEVYSGYPTTLMALRFTAHVCQRPGEIRQAEWSEIDFEKATWTIPASRMKQRQPHRVPLSTHAIAILRETLEFTGGGRFVFPKYGSSLRPMCENAINTALRRMGFDAETMTAHGFRTSASTLLNESGKWSSDAIERSLAHTDTNQVRAIYHRGSHWDERVLMAQWWSEYVCELRDNKPAR